MRYILIIVLFCSVSLCGLAQELNARLTINSSKIQSADQQVIKELETAIKRLLTDQSWSNAKFETKERIDCSIGITLNAYEGSTYSADIQITSRRPVYGSAYVTTLLNYKDAKFDFSYMLGQQLQYNEMSLDNNIVAVIAFYINIILGLDFDSFALNGGKPYFTAAMDIANKAQTLGVKGWEPFDGKSRYDLALALTEESSKSFHTLWYNYHRQGLDEMSSNVPRGRIRMIETLKDLESLQEARPNSLLLNIFADAKLDEFIKACEKATDEEKKDIKARLIKIYPAKRTQINAMK